MTTTVSAKACEVNRKWLIIDAADKGLGRLATRVACLLRGKHKPIYTPHVDTGDYVIIINADKVRVTGAKTQDKIYYHHTGYPGGIIGESFEKRIQRRPELIIELAIKGMLPKNPLGRDMYRKLKVYAGAEHGHQAQQPEEFVIN